MRRPHDTQSKPFSILRPVSHPWKPMVDVERSVRAWADVDGKALGAILQQARTVAFDFETKGTDPLDPETRAVGVAFAWSWPATDSYTRWVYFSFENEEDAEEACSFLARVGYARWREGRPTVAHNAYFDDGILRMHLHRRDQRMMWPTCTYECVASHCTYVLLKSLSSEGWPGQSWSLKTAMVDLLGWTDTNEAGIDEWLLAHGHHKQGPKLLPDETPEQHLARVWEWEQKASDRRGKEVRLAPNKAEMWRVPSEVLGPYACLDAVAAVQLFEQVLRPQLDRFPELALFHRGPYMHLLSLLVDQRWSGIRMDRPRLEAHAKALTDKVAKLDAELAVLCKDHIEAWRAVGVDAVRAKEPPRFRKEKERKEPERLKKNGDVSKNWIRWKELSERPPAQSKAWDAWNLRLTAAKSADPSWDSDPFFRWVLYSDLVKEMTGSDTEGDGPTGGTDRGAQGPKALLDARLGEAPNPAKHKPGTVVVTGRHGEVDLDLTDSSCLPTDGDAVGQIVDDAVREALLARGDAVKELQYATSYLEQARFDVRTQTWRLHPSWVLYGTKTGRLSGRDPNLQQVPKSLDLLDCFIPDVDSVWIEADAAALEPHVLAELSRDPGLMDLYGPDASPNHDRYLWSAAGYPGPLWEAVRSLYVPRSGPPRDRVAEAKKVCKVQRTIAKQFVLAGDYGAGARKIWRSSRAQGIQLSLDEATEIHAAHRKNHAGVYEVYAPRLEKEWKERGGWVLGGLGFPVPVYEKALKDLVNRVVQSTAHFMHVLLVSRLKHKLGGYDVQVQGVVWDFHDQYIFQVCKKDADVALALCKEVTAEVNAELGLTVPLKYGPRIVRSMSEAKMEEEYMKREALHDKGPR